MSGLSTNDADAVPTSTDYVSDLRGSVDLSCLVSRVWRCRVLDSWYGVFIIIMNDMVLCTSVNSQEKWYITARVEPGENTTSFDHLSAQNTTDSNCSTGQDESGDKRN